LTLSVDDLKGMTGFYANHLGLKVSDSAKETVHLRHGSDHHSLVLSESSSDRDGGKLLRIGIQVQTYEELLNAATYLKDRGVELISKGRSFPGGEYFVDFIGPDKQPLRLFFHMDKIGWDGLSRPRSSWKPLDYLPPTCEAPGDVYEEELPSAYNVY
ncbi:MAG: VOC family protein, partial [Rhabdochlamydiaceae bacterium]